MITQGVLKSRLSYDPLSGKWTWLARPEATAAWNGRFAGEAAGGIDPDTGYLRIRIDDELFYAHRLAFLYMTGEWPADQVDHKNQDRADCRWENLREATNAENNANKPLSPRNKSGFRGVSFDKNSGRWASSLMVNGKRVRRFGFSTPEQASEAYWEDVAKYGSEFHWDIQVSRASHYS